MVKEGDDKAKPPIAAVIVIAVVLPASAEDLAPATAPAEVGLSSSLSTRISSDGYRENNVARVGIASSSGAYYSTPAWTVNLRREHISIPVLGQ